MSDKRMENYRGSCLEGCPSRDYEKYVEDCFSVALDQDLVHDFEGCEHVIEELWTYAAVHGISLTQMYAIINDAYVEHEHEYRGLDCMAARELDMRLLDVDVRAELVSVGEKVRGYRVRGRAEGDR